MRRSPNEKFCIISEIIIVIIILVTLGCLIYCGIYLSKDQTDIQSLTIEQIDKVEKPIGYTYTVTEGDEIVKEGTFFYNKKLKNLEGLVPHHYTVLRTTSGPEDDMIYTLCDTNSDGSEYVLFITNPKDKQHFVACGVQEDNRYYLYTFIY